jgi:hypothetical protein
VTYLRLPRQFHAAPDPPIWTDIGLDTDQDMSRPDLASICRAGEPCGRRVQQLPPVRRAIL